MHCTYQKNWARFFKMSTELITFLSTNHSLIPLIDLWKPIMSNEDFEITFKLFGINLEMVDASHLKGFRLKTMKEFPPSMESSWAYGCSFTKYILFAPICGCKSFKYGREGRKEIFIGRTTETKFRETKGWRRQRGEDEKQPGKVKSLETERKESCEWGKGRGNGIWECIARAVKGSNNSRWEYKTTAKIKWRF